MMTVSQFEAMIPLGRSIELADLLDQAMLERGAATVNPTRLRLSPYYNERAVIAELYDRLASTAKNFLVDPAEITLTALRNASVRTYDLAALATACDRELLVPVDSDWTSARPLTICRDTFPRDPENAVTTQYARPRLLPRLYGEYFRQAAQMLRQLRYYAPTPLQNFIKIPDFAAENSISCVYGIYINAGTWDEATQFRFSKVWEDYLAPGRYDHTSFDLDVGEDFPRIVFAGSVDLYNDLQFFTT